MLESRRQHAETLAAGKQHTDEMKKLTLAENAQKAVSAELAKNTTLTMLQLERNGILQPGKQPTPEQLQKVSNIDANIKAETQRVYAPFLQYGVFNPYGAGDTSSQSGTPAQVQALLNNWTVPSSRCRSPGFLSQPQS